MDNMAWLQIKIYTRKFFRTLKKESIISIIMGVIITLIVMAVTGEDMFETFEDTKSGLFALVCVCIWIGIFNSIQLVCREKNDIVKDELDKSLHATSYMAAHFIYQFFLCFIQSFIVFVIFYIFMSDKGDIGSPIVYFITIFLIMYAADAMAFVISTAVPNPIVAMTVMPLLLLIQLVMAGVLFTLKGASEVVANFTISKWGMSALGITGDIIDIDSALGDPALNSDNDMFIGDMGDVVVSWFIFIVFIVAFYFLSVAALKLTTRKVKK
ncbi:MAG: ABC transporter permease [Clostridia bacterium]|nr:ABC transporter permease [Clostridia bacterium]